MSKIKLSIADYGFILISAIGICFAFWADHHLFGSSPDEETVTVHPQDLHRIQP
jgi:hypothetical protein